MSLVPYAVPGLMIYSSTAALVAASLQIAQTNTLHPQEQLGNQKCPIDPVQGFIFDLESHLQHPLSNEKALTEFFQKIVSEKNPAIATALNKPQSYWRRLFSKEDWSEWLEHRTPLGRVVNAFAGYVRGEPRIKQLDAMTVQRADCEAQWILAQLNETSQATKVVIRPLYHSGCDTPLGPYWQSCRFDTEEISHLPAAGVCVLDVECSRAPTPTGRQKNQVLYNPWTTPSLRNDNGTIKLESTATRPGLR
jgi:hypothetical protein